MSNLIARYCRKDFPTFAAAAAKDGVPFGLCSRLLGRTFHASTLTSGCPLSISKLIGQHWSKSVAYALGVIASIVAHAAWPKKQTCRQWATSA